MFNWTLINLIFKSNCSPMFYKIDVLKNFVEFTWNHMRSVTLKRNSPVWVFSCEFFKIFKNPIFTEHLWTTASGFFHSLNYFLPPSELIETMFFSTSKDVLSQLLKEMNIMNFASEKLYFAKETSQLLQHRKAHFSETPCETHRIEQYFFRLIKWLTFIYIYIIKWSYGLKNLLPIKDILKTLPSNGINSYIKI